MTEKPSELSSEAESRDELRDRWVYSAGVFFLVVPFTLFVSYMTGSLVGVGFGVALVAWRVAATPEITNRFSLRVGGRPRQFLHDLVIGILGDSHSLESVILSL